MEIRSTRVPTQPLLGTSPLGAAPSTETPAAPSPGEAAPKGAHDTNTLSAKGQHSELTLEAQREAFGFEANPHYQTLKAAGKVTPDVMAELSRLSIRPLADGIDRRALIDQVLQDLANPADINQGSRQTCAATVIQTALALDDPAAYLKLVGGLASPEGKATLANGDTVSRDPNRGRNGGKSLTGDLIQPAFMQYATGGAYDSITDTRKTANGNQQGLYADEQDKLSIAVTGKQTEAVFGNSPALMQAVAAATANGQPVSAILNRGNGKSHAVLVESIKDGKVTILDPLAGRKTLGLAEFQSQLQSVSLPKDRITASLRAASEQNRAGGRGVLATGFLDCINPINLVKKGVEAVTHVAQATVAVVTSTVQKTAEVATNVLTAVGSAVSNAVTGTVQAGSAFLQGVATVGGTLGHLWNQYGSYVMMGASIASMFIPGMQIVTLGLAAYQAFQSGGMLLEGIQTGDLKKSLLGVAGIAAAFSGGAGALGAKVLGNGAMAAANLAGKVGNIAKQVVAFTDAIQEGNPGKVLGALAGVVGGGAAMIGSEAEAFVKGATDFAEKASAYGQKAEVLYRALTTGDFNAATLATGLASDLVGDFGGNAEVQANLKRASTVIGSGLKAADALQHGDLGKTLELTLSAGATLGIQLPQNEALDKVARLFNLSARGHDAIQRRDVNGARSALRELGRELGIEIPGLEHLSEQNLHRASGIFAAAQRGDVVQALALTAELGPALGVPLPQLALGNAPHLPKLQRMFEASRRGADAVQRGDVPALLTAAEIGLAAASLPLPRELTASLHALGTLEAQIKQAGDTSLAMRDRILGSVNETVQQVEQVTGSWQASLDQLQRQSESLLQALQNQAGEDANTAIGHLSASIAAFGKTMPFGAEFAATLAQVSENVDQAAFQQASQHAQQLARQAQETMDGLRAQQERIRHQAAEIEKAVRNQRPEAMAQHLQVLSRAAQEMVGRV